MTKFKEWQSKYALSISIFISIIYFVFIIYLLLTKILPITKLEITQLDQVGGYLSGAFSPLVFAWLIFGYVAQNKQLIQQTKEFKLLQDSYIPNIEWKTSSEEIDAGSSNKIMLSGHLLSDNITVIKIKTNNKGKDYQLLTKRKLIKKGEDFCLDLQIEKHYGHKISEAYFTYESTLQDGVDFYKSSKIILEFLTEKNIKIDYEIFLTLILSTKINATPLHEKMSLRVESFNKGYY